jgi:hypothetical protein
MKGFGGERVTTSDVGEADQGVHHCELARMIELQTRDMFPRRCVGTADARTA